MPDQPAEMTAQTKVVPTEWPPLRIIRVAIESVMLDPDNIDFDALKEAHALVIDLLAAPACAAPVAWMCHFKRDDGIQDCLPVASKAAAFTQVREELITHWTPLFTAPPQDFRAGLLAAAKVCEEMIPKHMRWSTQDALEKTAAAIRARKEG